MYQIIASILLKFGLGFISDKFRTYGAEKLQDGDLADQKFRSWIVRELDDIKFKLDGLSRKDLSTSISFLKQGVERLHMSFGESTESGDSSTSESMKDGKQSQNKTNAGVSTSNHTKSAQKLSTLEDAIALANAIGELKIQSNERFKLAKESFKKAAEKASEAFHNAALSSDERVLASKVRIASGILDHLEDPEVSASDCLQYLQELHNMPAIQEIFSVHIKGGIKSWIKSAFKKDSRTEIVETVTKINLILADFISKFTKRRMAIFDWPMIHCGKRLVHPIHYEEESSVRRIKLMGITVPWEILMLRKTAESWWRCALNSKGDIIRYTGDDINLQKLDRATGKCQPFCVSALDAKTWRVKSIAIDDNDMVYVLSCKKDWSYRESTLSIYSSGGKIILQCSLDFIKETPDFISVFKSKEIAIYGKRLRYGTVYVCGSNGNLMKSFRIRLQPDERATSMTASCNNSSDKEIIITTKRRGHAWIRNSLVFVYTQEGQLKRTLKLRQQLINDATVDHVTKSYIICSKEDCSENTCHVECLSETGERRNMLCLDMENITGYVREADLVSHANGVIAIVNPGSSLYLRSRMM